MTGGPPGAATLQSWTGGGVLLRRALHRERVRLPVTVAALAGTAALSAAATDALYVDPAERGAAVGAITASPALLAMYGPLSGDGAAGALALWKLGVLGAAAAAVVAVLVVVRHTRAEEDGGRTELVASAGAGRWAPTAAAGLTATTFAAGLTLVTATALAAAGLGWGGALAFAATWGGAALVFAGVGLLTAEIAGSARVATTLAVLGVVAAYLVRAVGDATGGTSTWMVWVSPLGWGERVDPFGARHWWVLAIPPAVALTLLGAALAVRGRRDLGTGLLHARPGRAEASPLLRGPVGLAVHRERGLFAVATAAFAVVGAVAGSVTSQLGGMLDSVRMRQVVTALGGAHAMSDAFLVAEFGLLASAASLVVAAAVLRMAAEERSGRADAVLSAPVGRARWFLAHLGVAAAGGLVMLAVGGAAAGVTHGTATTGTEVVRLTAAALAQAPAVLFVACLAAAGYGLARRSVPLVWLVVAGLVTVAELGPVLGAPSWVLDLSPFTHVPHLPGGAVDVAAVLATLAVAIVIAGVGAAAFRQRDLA
ncbi:ABC transporter permease [Pseudonocardia sp. N23]|uniref:ABC transporter permease n=1 Tax=Pseudonocardia sp. N23 TaxID=1987376 RepID=UPI000BFD73AD|nr:ABC transporter permease [Pseudonocardia sp. N23]GAY07328.1 possible ABC antibiotics transporter [Pseudonocardia sp. N23]